MKTAVEWFFSELERMQYFIGNDMLEALKKAKEMEKQQQGYSEEEVIEVVETLEEVVIKEITSYNELMNNIGVEDDVDYKEFKQDEFDIKSAIKWSLFGAKWQIDKQDEFTIGFAEWFNNLKYDVMRYKTMEEHLEIYKKEKGL